MFSLAFSQNLYCQICRANRYVQHMCDLRHLCHRLSSPSLIDIQRQTMIKAIVGISDAIEELFYMLFFVQNRVQKYYFFLTYAKKVVSLCPN